MALLFRKNPKKHNKKEEHAERSEAPADQREEADRITEKTDREPEKMQTADTGGEAAGIFSLPWEEFLAQKVAALGDGEDEFHRFTMELQIQRETEPVPAPAAAADRRLDMLLDKVTAFAWKWLRCGKEKAASWAGLLGGKLVSFTELLDRKEAALSERAAYAMECFDSRHELACRRCALLLTSGLGLWDHLRRKAERNRRKLLVGFSCVIVVCAAGTMAVGAMTAYEYSYNGKTLGVVKDQQDVLKTLEIIGENLDYVYGAQVRIDAAEDISFKRIIALNQETDDKEDILTTLTYMQDMQVTGYALYVGGSRMAVFPSEEDVEDVLDVLKAQYVVEDENRQFTKVGFVEDVEIKELTTRLGSMDDKEQVQEYLLTGGVEEIVYEVKSGDTFSEIAKSLGLSQAELAAFNPDVVPDTLHIGQQLVLNAIVPLLTVETTEIATYQDKIDYEIVYEETSALYIGETEVKSAGVYGQRQVVAEITRQNGVEVSREELSQEIYSEPVSQVVLTGTKELPPLIGTGTFVSPVRSYTLTSRFGTRWGRAHTGIDMAASYGTSIYATDGGKVISAGWEGAKGYCIRIDHGQNITSVYAHLSSMLVSAGDSVYQGQKIGLMGSTGYSTGSHLHFEILVNGVAKNPLNYL